MTKPLVPLIGYLTLALIALAAVLLVALGQPPTTGRGTFAAPTPSEQTGSSGGTTSSATTPTPPSGVASGSTSTAAPTPTCCVVVLLATSTPRPQTPEATRAPYVWPTATNEAAYGGAEIGGRR